MALLKCPECGKEISDKATSCPNCGYPINAATIHTENGNDEIFLDEYKDDEIEDTNSNTSSRLSKFKDIIIGSHIWIPLVCIVIIVFIILILVFSKNRQQKNIQYSNNNNVNTILQSSTQDISTTENTEETSTESIQEDIEIEDTQIEKSIVNRENNENINERIEEKNVNENEIVQTENPIRNNSNNNITEKKTERVHVLKAAQSLPLNDLKYYVITNQILTKASVLGFEYKAQKYSESKDLYTIRLRLKMTYRDESTSISSIFLTYYIYDSNGIQVDSRPIGVSGAQLNKEITYEFLTYLEPGVYTIEFADHQ